LILIQNILFSYFRAIFGEEEFMLYGKLTPYSENII